MHNKPVRPNPDFRIEQENLFYMVNWSFFVPQNVICMAIGKRKLYKVVAGFLIY